MPRFTVDWEQPLPRTSAVRLQRCPCSGYANGLSGPASFPPN